MNIAMCPTRRLRSSTCCKRKIARREGGGRKEGRKGGMEGREKHRLQTDGGMHGWKPVKYMAVHVEALAPNSLSYDQ